MEGGGEERAMQFQECRASMGPSFWRKESCSHGIIGTVALIKRWCHNSKKLSDQMLYLLPFDLNWCSPWFKLCHHKVMLYALQSLMIKIFNLNMCHICISYGSPLLVYFDLKCLKENACMAAVEQPHTWSRYSKMKSILFLSHIPNPKQSLDFNSPQ